MPSRSIRVLTFFGVLAALIGAFIILGNVAPDPLGSFLRSPSGFLLGGVGEESVNFTASLNFAARQAINLEGRTANFTVDLAAPNTLVLNSLRRNSSLPARLEVGEFDGKLIVGYELEIDGSGKTVKIEGDDWSSGEGGGLSIKGTALVFQAATFQGVPKTSFAISNATGALTIEDGKATFNLDSEDIEIWDFTGTLTVGANSLVLNGSGKIKSSLLKSPA